MRSRWAHARVGTLCAIVGASSCVCTNGTVPPPGTDLRHFDPHAGLGAIVAFAGPGAVLTAYTLSYVKSDGTMDLEEEAYVAHAEYKFELPATPDPTKPVGAGGFVGPGTRGVKVEIYRPGQWRHVESSGSNFDYRFQGMERIEAPAYAGEVTKRAPPACAPKQLWAAAAARGAPANAVARIDWDDHGYDFTIDGTNIDLAFDDSCAIKPAP